MITEKEVVAGSMIYIMLQSIDQKETAGKRSRKGISRAIKKELATYVEESGKKEKYLTLVNAGFDLVYKAKDELGIGEVVADPGTIISTLVNRWPDMISGFNIKDEHINSLKAAYSDSKLQFISVKYANRMHKVVSEYLNGEKIDGQHSHSGRIGIHKNKRELNTKK